MLRPYRAKIFFLYLPRALPWAGILRPFRAKKYTPIFRMGPISRMKTFKEDTNALCKSFLNNIWNWAHSKKKGIFSPERALYTSTRASPNTVDIRFNDLL